MTYDPTDEMVRLTALLVQETENRPCRQTGEVAAGTGIEK